MNSVDDLREEYAQNELDQDRRPTEQGFIEWMAHRLAAFGPDRELDDATVALLQATELPTAADVQVVLDQAAADLAECHTDNERAEAIAELLGQWYAMRPDSAVTDPHGPIAAEILRLLSVHECGHSREDLFIMERAAADEVIRAARGPDPLPWETDGRRELPIDDTADPEDGSMCESSWRIWGCTRPKGHTGRHRAGTGIRVAAEWRDQDAESSQHTSEPDDYVIVPHGPVTPPYGSPEREAYDRAEADHA